MKTKSASRWMPMKFELTVKNYFLTKKFSLNVTSKWFLRYKLQYFFLLTNSLLHNFFRRRIKNNESNLNEVQNKKFTNRPSLPAGTKLLSFISFERGLLFVNDALFISVYALILLIYGSDGKGEVIRRREWIMNPNGKSYVSILHEYLQQSLKIQPVYEFKENGWFKFSGCTFSPYFLCKK